MEQTILVFHIRRARLKARDAAQAEVVQLLFDLTPALPQGGPLSEERGVFWVSLPETNLAEAVGRLPRLGYTSAVDVIGNIADLTRLDVHIRRPAIRSVRWRGKMRDVIRLYEENPDWVRQLAPDRREFLVETNSGALRRLKGYRGSSVPLRRRGLPVYDARVLVNLVSGEEKGIFLDPFAGVGGVVLEALASGWNVVSADNDPMLRFGLAELADLHLVANALQLPLATDSVDAIATEPPYEGITDEDLAGALKEMCRVLKPGGKVAILPASRQKDGLRTEADRLGLEGHLDSTINRKGLEVVLLVWSKGGQT